MTLIAAVRSADGIAIAADSQETVGDYRRSVQKLTPRNDGNLHTVIAGSGDGELIDSFILRFYKNLPLDISSLVEFVAFAEQELENFYAVDVALCPDRPEDKHISLLIGASLESTGEFDAWRCKNIRLEKIGAYELLGWGDTMYHGVVQRLLSPTISLQQSILAAIYAIVIAEETSIYVKGPISSVVILPKDIWTERTEYVKEIEGRLSNYEKHIHEIFLSCADSTISPSQLQAKLQEFSSTVLALHKGHLDAVARDLDNLFNTPIMKLPPRTRGTLMGTGELVTEYDADMSDIEPILRQLRVAAPGRQKPSGPGNSDDPEDAQPPKE